MQSQAANLGAVAKRLYPIQTQRLRTQAPETILLRGCQSVSLRQGKVGCTSPSRDPGELIQQSSRVVSSLECGSSSAWRLGYCVSFISPRIADDVWIIWIVVTPLDDMVCPASHGYVSVGPTVRREGIEAVFDRHGLVPTCLVLPKPR